MAVVVVTGPAGHVGANLVRALLAEGQQVRALVHRDRRALEGLGVDRVQGDVRDLDSLHRVFSGALRAADRAPVSERYILSGH